MRRARYQFGFLELVKRKEHDVWTFRFYTVGPDGMRRYRRVSVGTTIQYPTESAALKAAEALRLSANTSAPGSGPVLVDVLIERYRREALPDRFSTRMSYSSMLRRHIQPRWGNIPLQQIRPLEVEAWLKSLKLASNTKSHLRNLLHLLFQWALRWELVDKNPVQLVRQSKRRRNTPRRLSVQEFRQLLKQLDEPCHTMAVLAACIGLRIGEILGLQWGDINFSAGALSVQRAVYQYHIGAAKTSYSEASLPLAKEVISALTKWRSQAQYRAETDWVFASDKGTLRDGGKLREKVLQPAAKRAELGKIGWHSLRHSFATALDTAGARMKVAQELMRHANISTTMDVYTGAMERDKREAASQVARSFLGTSEGEKSLSNPNEP